MLLTSLTFQVYIKLRNKYLVLTNCNNAIKMTALFLPYVSTTYSNIRMPIIAAKDGIPAIKDSSESVRGLPTGDSCDCNIFVIGETQPHCRP